MHDTPLTSLNFLIDRNEGPNLLLEFYADISKQITRATTVPAILSILYTETRNIYANHTVELLFQGEEEQLMQYYFDEGSAQVVADSPFDKYHTLYNYAMDKQQAILTNSYEAFCRRLVVNALDITSRSWLGIPMIYRGRTYGILVLRKSGSKGLLRLQDKHFLSTLTDMATAAIDSLLAQQNAAPAKAAAHPFTIQRTIPNTIRGAMLQIQELAVKTGAVYSGLFLRTRRANAWRVLSEAESISDRTLRRKLVLRGLANVDQELFNIADPIPWQYESEDSRLDAIFDTPGEPGSYQHGIVLPFVIDANYVGAWIIAYGNMEGPLSEETVDRLRFLSYITTQLIEKKALLEHRDKYDEYVKHLERMKVTGELASGTAHYLNNILSVIIGKGQLLQRKLEETPHYRDLDVLVKAALDGAQRVSRLQSYASKRDKAGTEEPVDVNQVVREVLEIVGPRLEQEAQLRGIHYDLEITFGDLKPTRGNAAELREVVLNLINNALDAMPRGGKLAVVTTQESDKLLLFVSDSGIGIPDDLRTKIFEAFFTTKGREGNGLGLSIVKDIVDRHNGQINIDSVPQRGTVFMIQLPTVPAAYAPEPQVAELFEPLSCRVLLVEAEGTVRETLREMLEDEGCTVAAAAHAGEAVSFFKDNDFDVVMADLSMPKVNGVELARKLKQLNPRIPIYIITGWTENKTSLSDARGIVNGIIHKPFDIDLIRQELLRAMRSRQVAEAKKTA